MDNSASPGRQEVLYRFAARKALEDLRATETIDESLHEHLNAHPMLGYCRDAVLGEDKDLLKKIAGSPDKPLALRRLSLKLLRHFEKDRDIIDFFYALWMTSADYEIKIEVLWSLLSNTYLSAEIYADIGRHFLAANWDQWLPLIVEKLEGDKDEQSKVKELMKRYFNLS